MYSITISFGDLSKILLNSNDKYNLDNLKPFLINKFQLSEENIVTAIKTINKQFTSKFKTQFSKCKSNKNWFLNESNNRKFLNLSVTIKFDNNNENRPPTTSINTHPPTTFNHPSTSSARRGLKKRGPRAKPYSMVSDRTKRRKAAALRQKYPPELLIQAAKPFLTPENDEDSNFSLDEALALFLEGKMTKSQYITMKQGADMKSKSKHLYPCYDYLLEAKKKCYPEGIEISETGAKVPLQQLLNHTSERLLEFLAEHRNFLSVSQDGKIDIKLICKYGLDGATGQSLYKQNFSNNFELEESCIILCCLVPLRIVKTDDGSTLHDNDRPSSPLFCRPISFQILKETEEATNELCDQIEKEIEELQPHIIKIGEVEITIHFEMKFTMVDGKVSILSKLFGTILSSRKPLIF